MSSDLRIRSQYVGTVRAEAKELKAIRLYVVRQPEYRLDWLPFLVAYCCPALKVASDLLGGHACAPPALFCCNQCLAHFLAGPALHCVRVSKHLRKQYR